MNLAQSKSSFLFIALLIGFVEARINPAQADQFSLRCVRFGQSFYMTFDTEGKHVVEESYAGTPFPGRINGQSGDQIFFEVDDAGVTKGIWKAGEQKLVFLADPGRSSSSDMTIDCFVIEPRLIPYEKYFGPYESYLHSRSGQP